jgi:hypothetical protein
MRYLSGKSKFAVLRRKSRLDCFVAEFIIGPAKGRTRWFLATTPQWNPSS